MNNFVKKQLKNVNAMLERWMKKRANEITFPEEVELAANIPYIDDGKSCHKMDIYRPRHTDGTLPVIVNIHGGGLLLCTKEVNRQFCAELAKRGFLVFCLEYPLVPESDIPGILKDISAGMDTVDSLIDKFGGDRNRIYQVGDSAGAFLSVYAVAAQSNADLAASIPVTPSRLNVKALGLISGMFYTTGLDSVGLFLRKDFYGKNWKKHSMHKYCHPDCQEIAGYLPPCFLVTSKTDNLRGYSVKFHKGLLRAGVPCELLDFPLLKDLQHDFVIVTPEHPDAQMAINHMAEFLLKY